MKKILNNSPKNKLYLESLDTLYLVGFWAGFGIQEFYFSGEYEEENGKKIPLVYEYYDDGNGTCGEFHLMKITETTTGPIIDWFLKKEEAEKLLNNLIKYEKI